jgi:hypothetical protein
MSKHTWQFASRFRRNAFGWQSDKPILRIKEAVAEIKKIARTEPNLAAQGAVIFIEKVSASLMHVDSSSGALSAHLNAAIEALAKLIAAAPATLEERQLWLKRLWKAMEEDEMPYLEYLSDFWGELCAGRDLASQWANEFFPHLEFAAKPGRRDSPYFRATPACFSALFAAQRYEEILDLVSRPKFHWWSERRWGVRCLAAMGKTTQAIELAVSKPELNDPPADIARACEDILLKAGMYEEAYTRFALKANQAMTHLARFRAIAKKYPNKAPAKILQDIVSENPALAGKWFAAAKDSGFYELAIELVSHSPADPRTLTRAARDHRNSQPRFALESGLAALRWIAADYGYEITADEISAAYREVILAIPLAGADAEDIKRQIRDWISGPTRIQKRMREVLA